MESDLERIIAQWQHARLLERIFARDYTVWKESPEEISNRLGWLDAPFETQSQLPALRAFVDRLRQEGFHQALLLGMGGSSLAPQVLRQTFGVTRGYLDLFVLDSTHPQAVREAAAKVTQGKTLFIVSTKSGSTVETLSFFHYFYHHLSKQLGAIQAGEHFIAITDAHSPLVRLAEEHHFRKVFLNNAEIGGRYSALSLFGMLPAMLIGVDVELLLQRAARALQACRQAAHASRPPACLRLGVTMAEMALAGRDKLTLLASPQVSMFGSWVEQLIAESSGKEGKGILPVVDEGPQSLELYGEDRFFVHLRLAGETSLDASVAALQSAGHSTFRLEMDDLYDLGAQFILWELATAVGGAHLRINPFDQPNVEASKRSARDMIQTYHQRGYLPFPPPNLIEGDIQVISDLQAGSLADTLHQFLAQAERGSYIALQAFLPPTPQSTARLQALRQALCKHTRRAVTCGFGPQYLHSTGQLHKGDAGKGLFIQLLAPIDKDEEIPELSGTAGPSLTFGVLLAAQALGDREALLQAGRKVLTLRLGDDLETSLEQLRQALGH